MDNFCIRARAGWWNKAKDFLASGEQSRLIRIRLLQKHAHKLAQFLGSENTELTLRLVRVDLQNGEETQVLCTSLLDEEQAPQRFFQRALSSEMETRGGLQNVENKNEYGAILRKNCPCC